MTSEAFFNYILPIFLSLLTSAIVLGSSWGKLSGGFKMLEKKVDEKFKDLKDDFRELRNDFKDMSCKMREHDKDIAVLKNFYGSSSSPMHPNERGKKLLEDSGFNSLYPKIKSGLFSLMDGLKTKTLYDAEKNSFTALSELQDKDEFVDMKHYAVTHPNESLELIFTIASWVIRDDYAKERKILK